MTSPPRRRRAARKRTVVPARPVVSRGRVVAAAVALAGVTVGFGWRLVDLQLTPDAALSGRIGSQIRGESIDAPRGDIVDRFGRRIALSLPRPSVIADPRLVPGHRVAAIVAQLEPLLSTDPSVLERRLRRDKSFVYLERQVDPDVGEAILALGLPGVALMAEQRREYPNGDCSGLSIVGRTDIDQKGISGMEEAFDDSLTGAEGYVVYPTRQGGAVQIPGGLKLIDPVEPGEVLELTFDRNVQYEAERLVIEALDATGGTLGIAIVSIPSTGEIIAMANVELDPDTGMARCSTTNLGATWTYEPGSIMKPFTFAAVFEHDAWGETTPVDILERIEVEREEGVENHVYTDVAISGDETHPPAWILSHSSNNGTIMLAQALGPDRLHQTLVDLGFGSRTALDFKGEAAGILDPLDTNSLILSSVAIGQSVAVTPIQVVQGFNTIANGGLRVDPVLVMDEVTAPDAVRILSRETADTVLRMMRGVVDDGTGKRAAIPGYVVAGKTGTAWQPCAAGVGYYCDDDRTHHYTASFVGIVENDRGPALSVLVIIDDPQEPHVYGGEIAAPIFADLAGYALQQLRIPSTTAGAAVDGRVRAAAAEAPPTEETLAAVEGSEQ